MWSSAARAPRGLTLIEVLFAATVSALLLAGVLALMLGSFRNNQFAYEQNKAVTIDKRAIELIARELREARRSDSGAWPLVETLPNQIIFYSDTDKDAVTERIRYTFSGSTIQRGIIEPVGSPATYPLGNEVVSTIATDVRNGAVPMFTYFDTNHVPQGNPVDKDATRLVHIAIIVNVTPQTAPNDYALETDVSLRNLKDNL